MPGENFSFRGRSFKLKAYIKIRNRDKENPDESTDDDEIEAKIESLFGLLEKGLQDQEKSFDKRRKILQKVFD